MTTDSIDSSLAGLQNQDLRIPYIHYDYVRQFTMRGQSADRGINRDNVPFNRYFDLWWLALCIGVQEGRRTQPPKWHTFVRAGEVLPSTPWRILQLQLMAVGVTGNTDILSNPGGLIALANEYAATGMPLVLDVMIGQQIPIWSMTQFVEDRLHSAGTDPIRSP